MANVNSVEEVDPNIPRVGMYFDSVEIAYDYYNSYARRIGFSVRRQRSAMDKAKTHIRAAEFVCSREGQYRKINSPKKKRDDTRCGCQALFKVKYVGGKYVLEKFVEKHDNHDTVTPDQAYLLRSQRNIDPKKKRIMKEKHNEISTPNIVDDIDPSFAADYRELIHMSQKIVAQSVGSKERVSVVRNSFSELAQTIAAMRINDEGPIDNEDDEEKMHMHDPKGKKVEEKEKRRKKRALEKGKNKNSKKTGETSIPSNNMVSAPPQTSSHDPNALRQRVILPRLNVLPYQVLWNSTMNYGVRPWQQSPNQYALPIQALWGPQLQPPPSVGTEESNKLSCSEFVP